MCVWEISQKGVVKRTRVPDFFFYLFQSAPLCRRRFCCSGLRWMNGEKIFDRRCDIPQTGILNGRRLRCLWSQRTCIQILMETAVSRGISLLRPLTLTRGVCTNAAFFFYLWQSIFIFHSSQAQTAFINIDVRELFFVVVDCRVLCCIPFDEMTKLETADSIAVGYGQRACGAAMRYEFLIFVTSKWSVWLMLAILCVEDEITICCLFRFRLIYEQIET